MNPWLVREKAVFYDPPIYLCGGNTFTGQREQQQQQHNLEFVTLWPKLAGKSLKQNSMEHWNRIASWTARGSASSGWRSSYNWIFKKCIMNKTMSDTSFSSEKQNLLCRWIMKKERGEWIGRSTNGNLGCAHERDEAPRTKNQDIQKRPFEDCRLEKWEKFPI